MPKTTDSYIIRLDCRPLNGRQQPSRYIVPPWAKGGVPKGWGTPQEAVKAMQEMFGKESVHIDRWNPQLIKLTTESVPWPE